MNKFLNYAILIYTILSGIVATLFAIGYFVIDPMLGGEVIGYYGYALSGMGTITNSHLNTTEQIAILDKLFNQFQVPSSIANNYVSSLSFNQFIEYESIFIVSPAALLLVVTFISRKDKKDE